MQDIGYAHYDAESLEKEIADLLIANNKKTEGIDIFGDEDDVDDTDELAPDETLKLYRCPTCKRPNSITRKDLRYGMSCDDCETDM
jgi:hypothetical protein